MRKLAAALVLLSFNSAHSEPGSSPLAGQWSGEVSGCGQFTLAIADVLPSGAVVGTVDCPELGVVRAVGDTAIRGKQIRGWASGMTLYLEGDHTAARVSLEANRLVGFATVPLARRVTVVLFRTSR